jgi:hypothetical protein
MVQDRIQHGTGRDTTQYSAGYSMVQDRIQHSAGRDTAQYMPFGTGQETAQFRRQCNCTVPDMRGQGQLTCLATGRINKKRSPSL